MQNMIRIPVSPETHEALKRIALERGAKDLSSFLRDVIQKEVGDEVNMRSGIKPRGGRRDRQAG